MGEADRTESKSRSALWAIIGIAFCTFPKWLHAVWGLFTEKPLIPWLKEKGIPTMNFSLLWITVPLTALIYVVYYSWDKRRNRITGTQQCSMYPAASPQSQTQANQTPLSFTLERDKGKNPST